MQRGILFMTFAGEELGLLGSADWVKEPTRPLGDAVAMINMDMIGRIRDNKVYVGGVGTGTTFKPLVEKVAAKYDFKLAYSAGGYSASDHTSFVVKSIPVAVLLLRAARGLSQAQRHLGEDRPQRRGPSARPDSGRCDWAGDRRPSVRSS